MWVCCLYCLFSFVLRVGVLLFTWNLFGAWWSRLVAVCCRLWAAWVVPCGVYLVVGHWLVTCGLLCCLVGALVCVCLICL